MTKRVYVYVDGFNLYYRALKGTDFKWLDIESFVYNFLEGAQRIDKLRYFTARVSGKWEPDTPRRQKSYLNALSSNPVCEIHYGNFLTKVARKPIVRENGKPGRLVDVLVSEEKGSDVNLGAHLVNDAHLDKFDVALVLSQDSDLLEPMRIVKAMGKPVGIIWLQPQKKVKDDSWTGPSGFHKRASSFIKFARKKHYREAQLDDTVLDLNSEPIATKPDGW